MAKKKTQAETPQPSAEKPKIGRPTKFTEERADLICALLMTGQSLIRICSLEDMPSKATVCNWLASNPAFLDQYTRAREVQAELLADELVEIADDDSRDTSGELGMPNSVAVQRARLKVETRKWVASKLLPKKYGDRVQQEVTGAGGGPIQSEHRIVFVDPTASA